MATGVTHALEVGNALSPSDPILLRTRLIFYTSFGDIRRAPAIIDDLLSLHRDPALDEEHIRSRIYCFLALLKIGEYQACIDLARREWEFMNGAGHLFAAEYAGSVVIEALVAQGNAVDARAMFVAIQESRARRPHAGSIHSPVYYSSIVALALLEQDFNAAQATLPHLRPPAAMAGLPRLRTVELALNLRVRQGMGDSGPAVSDVVELEALFRAGRCLGGLDLAAEALWHAYVQSGDSPRASAMLAQYLRERRELGQPEASLRQSTAGDPAWMACWDPALP